MIKIEVKSFEQKLDTNNPEDSRLELDKEIQHYLAFFQENLVDYNVSSDNYIFKNEIYFIKTVTLRHKKIDKPSEW